MIESQKSKLRKKFIKLRNSIKHRSFKEKKIKQKLEQLINLNNVPVGVYMSVKSEVDISNFVKYLQKNNQKIALPIIYKLNSHLLFKQWRINEKLVFGKFNIKIPSNDILLNPKILLIPMVSFDSKKNRLGYGGGYYDKTISFFERNGSILKFGIAFDEQETEKVPSMEFDKKMDIIVTQSRIII